jgi:hypothetical protein
MKRSLFLLLVLSLAIPNNSLATSPCQSIINKCDAALNAQDREISGLKEALKQSQDATNRCLKSKIDCIESTPTLPAWGWVLLGGLAGFGVGSALK